MQLQGGIGMGTLLYARRDAGKLGTAGGRFGLACNYKNSACM